MTPAEKIALTMAGAAVTLALGALLGCVLMMDMQDADRSSAFVYDHEPALGEVAVYDGTRWREITSSPAPIYCTHNGCMVRSTGESP